MAGVPPGLSLQPGAGADPGGGVLRAAARAHGAEADAAAAGGAARRPGAGAADPGGGPVRRHRRGRRALLRCHAAALQQRQVALQPEAPAHAGAAPRGDLAGRARGRGRPPGRPAPDQRRPAAQDAAAGGAGARGGVAAGAHRPAPGGAQPWDHQGADPGPGGPDRAQPVPGVGGGDRRDQGERGCEPHPLHPGDRDRRGAHPGERGLPRQPRQPPPQDPGDAVPGAGRARGERPLRDLHHGLAGDPPHGRRGLRERARAGRRQPAEGAGGGLDPDPRLPLRRRRLQALGRRRASAPLPRHGTDGRLAAELPERQGQAGARDPGADRRGPDRGAFRRLRGSSLLGGPGPGQGAPEEPAEPVAAADAPVPGGGLRDRRRAAGRGRHGAGRRGSRSAHSSRR